MKRKQKPALAFVLRIAALVALLPALIYGVLTSTPETQATGVMFTFGAGGDHGTSGESAASFQAVGAADLNFFQTLGDLSYGSNAGVPAWCQSLKDNINIGASFPTGNAYGENYPFMLLTGNHETDEQSNGSDIDTFIQCLPNQFASQSTMSPNVGTGTDNYAKEYYYDYPAISPFARFIVTSPDIAINSNGTYQYTSGNAHYQWLSDAIDSARTAGYKWVIVSSHKNYISTGNKSNEVGSDYFNLLVDKKVDLILQGHDHTHQRSKQLALSASCPAVTTGTPDLDCIVDDGSDDAYTKGSGSVLVISGNFGHSFYTADTGDSEYPYFSKIMPSSNNTNGFVKFTVDETSIIGTFTKAIGDSGTFTDSFTIAEAGGSDTTPPSTSLTAPADGATISGTSSLTATASDNVAVTKVEFYANAVKIGEDLTSPYAYDWDTTGVSNGSYALTSKAFDAAANETTSTTATVTVTNAGPPSDTTPPSVTLTAPTDGATVIASTQLTATASDNVGVTKVEFYKDAVKLGEDTSSPYTYSWDVSSFSDGTYAITAKAYDGAANVTTSTAATITLTKSVKNFTVSTPSGGVATVSAGGTCNSTLAGTSAAAPGGLAGKTIAVGSSFQVGCASPGTNAQVVINLGKVYTSPETLKVYKTAGATLTDITAQTVIANVTVSGTLTTTVTYTITDGGFGDADATANSVIDDPVFVTEVAGTSTTSLAGTGMNASAFVGLSASLFALSFVTQRLSVRKNN